MPKNEKSLSMKDVAAMIKSPAGQELLQILQKQDPKAVNQAAVQAQAGNYDDAKNSIQALLQSPDIQRLVAQMRDSHG